MTNRLMIDLRRFVFRHRIFVEAREFEDGVLFTRPRRSFRVWLRREKRRVHVYTVTCGSSDEQKSQISVDFPEKALLRPAEAALEYEECGRDIRRYAAGYPKDPDAGHALFAYVRSESRILERLLGHKRYLELLRIVRSHRRRRPSRHHR